ncbi:MAG: aspartate ammonia-lyase, partial [Ignavibacteriaceae bacterium]|nr:aspartate ammonia-lyase [Ignavibacteriaceae bacterium]
MFKKNKLIISIIFGLVFLPSVLFGQEGFRIEKDLLGEKQIPNDAYYGVQTLRALENFQISGITTKDYPELVNAFVLVKLAAARANYESGALPKYVLDAVERACT